MLEGIGGLAPPEKRARPEMESGGRGQAGCGILGMGARPSQYWRKRSKT